MAQTPSLTKRHAYLQQRNLLSASPLSLEIWGLPDPVEYVDPANASTPIPVAAPAACREGLGEIPTDARYTDGSSKANSFCTWTAVTIQPNTDAIWLKQE